MRPRLCLLLVLTGALNLVGADSWAQDETPKEEIPIPGPKDLVIAGALTASSPQGAHSLRLQKDQAYNIHLESRGFFSHLRIEDADGKAVLSTTGATAFKPPGDGTFRFLVFSPGGSSGLYSLTIRRLPPSKPNQVLSVSDEGLIVEDFLTNADPLDRVRKTFCKVFEVKMSGEKKYTIDMLGKQFDAYLRLEDAAGKQLAQDDDSGGGNNARIIFQPNSDGIYRVIATTFAKQTGQFTLKIRAE